MQVRALLPLLARLRAWAFVAAVLLAALIAIVYATDGSGTRLSNNQLIGQICAFLIAAIGLNLLVGRTGMHSFAQGAFIGLGAYAFIYTQVEWSAHFFVGLLVAAAVPTLFGVVIAVATTRMRGPQLAMVTLILAVVVFKVLSEWKAFGQFGGYPNTAAHGSSLVTPPDFFGWALEPPLFGGVPATALVPVIILAACALLFFRRVVATPWGLSLMVIKQSEVLAAHLGVNVYLRKIAAISLAAGMAGIGGACYALVFAHLQPETFGLMLGVNLIVMVILGGSGTVMGPVIGTAAIVYLQTAPSVAGFVRWQNDTISDRWYLSPQGLIALLMIAVLFLMPAGIVGSAKKLWRRYGPSVSSIPEPRVGTAAAAAQALFGKIEASGTRPEPALAVSGVGLSFGGVKAVDDVSIRVAGGEILAIIGPNGAGKSSLVNVVSGVYAAQSGSIALGSIDVTAASSHQRRRLGLARTFQTPILSPELTVAENVAVGARSTGEENLLEALVALPRSRRRRQAEGADVETALALVGLSAVADRAADELSYGQQRLVELARAVVARPQVLVLDEPAAGLNPTEIGALAEILENLRGCGIAVLVVEHHMDLVRRVGDEVVCMIDGGVVAQGPADAVLSDERVVSAYLGGSVDSEVTGGINA